MLSLKYNLNTICTTLNEIARYLSSISSNALQQKGNIKLFRFVIHFFFCVTRQLAYITWAKRTATIIHLACCSCYLSAYGSASAWITCSFIVHLVGPTVQPALPGSPKTIILNPLNTLDTQTHTKHLLLTEYIQPSTPQCLMAGVPGWAFRKSLHNGPCIKSANSPQTVEEKKSHTEPPAIHQNIRFANILCEGMRPIHAHWIRWPNATTQWLIQWNYTIWSAHTFIEISQAHKVPIYSLFL